MEREGSTDHRKLVMATVVQGDLNPRPKSLNAAEDWSLNHKPLPVDLA